MITEIKSTKIKNADFVKYIYKGIDYNQLKKQMISYANELHR